MVARRLTYAEEGETKKMDLRELRLEETDGEKEFEDTRKIVNFLSRLIWPTQANPQGGITWLELFVWIRLHKFEKA